MRFRGVVERLSWTMVGKPASAGCQFRVVREDDERTVHFLNFTTRMLILQPMISAFLIPQLHLSIRYILQHNAILTDMTYPVFAVTLKETRVFENKLGIFTY
jgi:hypothetical protein